MCRLLSTCELFMWKVELRSRLTVFILTLRFSLCVWRSCIKLLRLPQLLTSGGGGSAPNASTDGRPTTELAGDAANNVTFSRALE